MTNKCYYNQTGEYQVDLDELNRQIVFLCENGKYNEKNDWIIGRQYLKLDRLRKVQRAYVALHENNEASRLLGVSPKDVAKGGEKTGNKYPAAEAALEAAIIAAKREKEANDQSQDSHAA